MCLLLADLAGDPPGKPRARKHAAPIPARAS